MSGELERLEIIIDDVQNAYDSHKYITAGVIVSAAPSTPANDRRLYLRNAEDHEEDPFRLVPTSFLKMLRTKLAAQEELIATVNKAIDEGRFKP